MADVTFIAYDEAASITAEAATAVVNHYRHGLLSKEWSYRNVLRHPPSWADALLYGFRDIEPQSFVGLEPRYA